MTADVFASAIRHRVTFGGQPAHEVPALPARRVAAEHWLGVGISAAVCPVPTELTRVHWDASIWRAPDHGCDRVQDDEIDTRRT